MDDKNNIQKIWHFVVYKDRVSTLYAEAVYRNTIVRKRDDTIVEIIFNRYITGPCIRAKLIQSLKKYLIAFCTSEGHIENEFMSNRQARVIMNDISMDLKSYEDFRLLHSTMTILK